MTRRGWLYFSAARDITFVRIGYKETPARRNFSSRTWLFPNQALPGALAGSNEVLGNFRAGFNPNTLVVGSRYARYSIFPGNNNQSQIDINLKNFEALGGDPSDIPVELRIFWLESGADSQIEIVAEGWGAITSEFVPAGPVITSDSMIATPTTTNSDPVGPDGDYVGQLSITPSSLVFTPAGV